MSRVERTKTPNETRGSNQSRQADHSRSNNTAAPTPTPTKAEGEQSDIEQALRNQKE